jgi:hypothetical protein
MANASGPLQMLLSAIAGALVARLRHGEEVEQATDALMAEAQRQIVLQYETTDAQDIKTLGMVAASIATAAFVASSGHDWRSLWGVPVWIVPLLLEVVVEFEVGFESAGEPVGSAKGARGRAEGPVLRRRGGLELADARLMQFSRRRHYPGVPPRCTSPFGRLDRIDVKSGACDQPGDHRVRIPHFSCTELVTAPHEHRHVRHQFEKASSVAYITAQSSRAVDCLADIRNYTVEPPAHFITKHS